MRKLANMMAAIAIAALAIGTPIAAAQNFEPEIGVTQPGYSTPAVSDAATYPAASLQAASGPVIDGNADLNWGDGLLTILSGLAVVIVTGIISIAGIAYTRLTGNKLEAADAERLRTYMMSAYHFALNAVAPAMRGKKLTVKDASPVVEWMLHYADQLLPGLVAQFGGREANRLRAWSIVDLAEGEAIPQAAPVEQRIASPQAPAAAPITAPPAAP